MDDLIFFYGIFSSRNTVRSESVKDINIFLNNFEVYLTLKLRHEVSSMVAK